MAIITISRGTLSGGKNLAEMLSERLGYRCVSREVIIEAADKYGVPEHKLFEAIQKGPSIFEKLKFERERYLAFIQATLCEYVKDDDVVYHGHAGHFLLAGIDHVLRVRIVADPAYRVRMAMQHYKLPEKEARKKIRQVDQERVKWTKFLYDRDWRSPALYDIVFNLQHTDLEFVCEMVQHAIEQPRFQPTPESKKKLDDLLLSSRVRAALAREQHMRLELLEVRADDGTVSIRGKSMTREMADEIMKIASGVPGVKKLDSGVQVDYRSYGIE
jgi:cytidylate kinase